MSDLGPGDWVECVDNGPRPTGLPAPELTVGSLYQVESLAELDIGIAVYLVGRPNPRDGAFHAGRQISGYALARFRPIYRPKQSIIEQLKQSAPDVVRELIAAD
jgi:hypothetical protein